MRCLGDFVPVTNPRNRSRNWKSIGTFTKTGEVGINYARLSCERMLVSQGTNCRQSCVNQLDNFSGLVDRIDKSISALLCDAVPLKPR